MFSSGRGRGRGERGGQPSRLTTQNLLHRFIPHLRCREALQGDDGGVRAVAQQEAAGLQVAGEGGSVQSRLTQGVQCVHLKNHWVGT